MEKKLVPSRIIPSLKDVIITNMFIILGCAVYGFGVNFFVKANELASGGFTGIGLILNYTLNVPVGLFFIIANIPLVIAGAIIWGKAFLAKTGVGILASSFFVELFAEMRFPVDNGLLAAIYGGIFMGAGVGLVIRNGGTTGGTDIIGIIVNKFTPLSMGTFYLVFDTCVICMVAFIYGLETAMNSLFIVFIQSKMVDIIVDGPYKGKQALIITNKHDMIVEYIRDHLHRGATILNAMGGYNYHPRQIVLCTVKRWELFKLRKEIQILDPDAFIIVSDAYEVYGKGFKANE